MFRFIFSVFFLAFLFDVAAQTDFGIFKFRSVGPVRGGRATAVAGTVVEPGTFYMGATGGGLWKTTDYGTSWDNVSDGYFTSPSIGDIAVSQHDPNLVYVGTGSDGLRSNVITGKGMYKSIDGGESWESIGLEKTGHIGAVELDPTDNQTVFVAAIGNAFGPSEERGVYRTKDGGRTWKKVLYISDKVGFSDVEFLPGNPRVIYATAWKAERKPWTIISGGNQDEGGIYKSIDGGDTWIKLTKGLPQGLIGKIDLGVSAADSKVLYALIEAPGEDGGLYKSENQGKTFKQVSKDRGIQTRPFYYCNVEVDPTDPDVVYVMATGYYKSIDGGRKWKRMSPPHGDNHDMWINPDNPDLFIQCNDGGANVTFNGGKTWSTQFNQPTAEIYQVEVDDQYPYWLYGGQQDNSTTIAVPSMAPTAIQAPESGWIINTGGCETGPAVPKPGEHYIVYANCKGRFDVYDKRTGTEKNYDVGAANMYGHNPNELTYRFQRVSPIHVSPHDPNVVYHASQFLHKTTNEGQSWETISPDLTAFEADKQVISGSPITRDITGEEFYSTIYSIRESPVKQGVIWVGANDGPVHVTTDGGENWKNVTPKKLPKGGRVDAVEPSPHDPAKAYIAVLRYQLDDWKPYIWRTVDYGKTWKLLTPGDNGIPMDYPTRVIREDPVREGLLYAGTEFGLFVSLDDGETWEKFQNDLPITPVTDIKVVRGDLAVSTMGRGFYILDNLTPMHSQAFDDPGADHILFKPRNSYRYRFPKMRGGNYPRPGVDVDYYLADSVASPIRLDILDADRELVATFVSGKKADAKVEENMALSEVIYTSNSELTTKAGLNRFRWDMKHPGAWHKEKKRRYRNGPMVGPGNYSIRLTIGELALEQSFILEPDPRVIENGVTVEDIELQEDLSLKLTELQGEARRLLYKIENELKKKDLPEDRKDLLEKIKESLDTKEGTYMKPMLIDQMGYLYYTVANGADFRPGRDAIDRFSQLEKKFSEIKAEMVGE